MKGKIKTTIQGTMVSPLWARAIYSKLYPELLDDKHSIDLIDRVISDYKNSDDEFNAMKKFIDEFMGINFLVRAKKFDNGIKNFIKSHPKATIVNLGCGLDTTFSRIDNGTISWFDLDLPDVITYRKHLIPEGERNKCISSSIFNNDWFTKIDYDQQNNIFFIAAGLFNYFNEKEIVKLFEKMAKKFPNGEIMFDLTTRFGNFILNNRLKRVGVEGISFVCDLNKLMKLLLQHSTLIKILEQSLLFEKIPRNPKWTFKTRLYMNISDFIKIGKYIHLKFV